MLRLRAIKTRSRLPNVISIVSLAFRVGTEPTLQDLGHKPDGSARQRSLPRSSSGVSALRHCQPIRGGVHDDSRATIVTKYM